MVHFQEHFLHAMEEKKNETSKRTMPNNDNLLLCSREVAITRKIRKSEVKHHTEYAGKPGKRHYLKKSQSRRADSAVDIRFSQRNLPGWHCLKRTFIHLI